MRLMRCDAAVVAGEALPHVVEQAAVDLEMISRWRGSISSNHASGHFSRASGSSVWFV